MGSLERCVGHVVLVENLVRSVTVAGSSVKIQSVADRIEKSKGKRVEEWKKRGIRRANAARCGGGPHSVRNDGEVGAFGI
jgi:hypothetical protein